MSPIWPVLLNCLLPKAPILVGGAATDARRWGGVAQLWAHVLAYPYLVMFSLMVVEGPLAMVTSGMLVATGVMSFLVVLLLAVVADVGADSAYFFAGRLARRRRARPAAPPAGPPRREAGPARGVDAPPPGPPHARGQGVRQCRDPGH